MNELEKAARNHRDELNSYLWSSSQDCSVEYAKEAFIDGAQWQAKQSPWIRTEDRLPEDNELVLTSSSIYGTKLLVWNEFHKVWDDEDGDDTYCERDKIDAWMPIPE